MAPAPVLATPDFPIHEDYSCRRCRVDSRIEHALKFLEAHCERRITVPLIASYFGLSRSRFEHLFRHETGTTFRVRLREIRLARGAALLADARLRIKEVSARCGYSATSSFTRAFEKRFGRSPSSLHRFPENAPQLPKSRVKTVMPPHSTASKQIAHSENEIGLNRLFRGVRLNTFTSGND